MGCINLYKIDEGKSQQLIQDLLKKMHQNQTVERSIRTRGGQTENFGLTLYLDRVEERKDISWNWVLDEFGEQEIQVAPSPKAVILVE